MAMETSLNGAGIANSERISLHTLLSACFSASELAGQVIRDVVHQDMDLQLVSKDDATYDPQTIADRRAQQRIMHALRHAWPQLQIVGEEGELDVPDLHDQVVPDLQALEHVFPTASNRFLDPAKLVVWIDPLDGTKKFAAKCFDEVSVLIGIAYEKRPIAGVMHLPFHTPNGGRTLYGGPGLGLYQTSGSTGLHVPVMKPSVALSSGLVVTHSGTNCELVNKAVKVLEPSNVLLGGATGTMVLTVLEGQSHAFFRFRNNTKRWDICAIEPLIMAIGGTIVDKYGQVYEYDHRSSDQTFDNAHGLVVTLDHTMQAQVLRVMQRLDMLRTVDGSVMTIEWLQTRVCPSASEVDVVFAHYGKQSAVARLAIASQDSTTSHVFLKRYVKAELPARDEAQWQRDLQSFQNEVVFYQSFYDRLTQNHGVPLIRPLCIDSAVSNEAFVLILEDLTATQTYEPVGPLGLSLEQTKAALSYLAKLHAVGLKDPVIQQQTTTLLWSSGGWWSLEKRGRQEVQQASGIWAEVLTAFAPLLESSGIEMADKRFQKLGARMAQAAPFIHEQLYGPCKFQTLMHGDFKSANLFFNRTTGDCVAFDWQWAGTGLGVLDLAYLLNTSVAIDVLVENEMELVAFYHAEWRQQLQDASIEYDLKRLETHYVMATLDYAKVLISRFWKCMTPTSCEQKAANTNCGLGYRSIPHVLRMMQRMDQALVVVETLMVQ